MVQAKISYLDIPFYSLISPSSVKDENKINNNYCAPHTHISNSKRPWTTFHLEVALDDETGHSSFCSFYVLKLNDYCVQ